MPAARPLPADIIERFGHLPDHQYHSGGEHSSACPQCGGGRGGRDLSDRFRFWERQGAASNFWCRRCGFAGFADDNKRGYQPDPARIKEIETMRQEQAEAETKRLTAMIAELQRAAYWQGWHDAMTENQRQLWQQAGIPRQFQDYWQLGHTTYQTKDFSSPALTIPYFSPGWQATTVQYRLINPPQPNDKYRFSAGLKASLWLADPDTKPKGAVLLCEGMKKAAVTFIHTAAAGVGKFQVTAVPSKMPGSDLLDILSDADPVYVCLDPDAYAPTRTKDGKIMLPAVNRLARLLKVPYKLVKLPCKADDFFTIHQGTARQFLGFLETARTV